jgi:hypothetical protein
LALSWTGLGFLLALLETCSLSVKESDIVVVQVRGKGERACSSRVLERCVYTLPKVPNMSKLISASSAPSLGLIVSPGYPSNIYITAHGK